MNTELDAENTYSIRINYAGSNMFKTMDKFVAAMPPGSANSTWAKTGSTVSTTITNVQLEDIVALKLKFDMVIVKAL